MDDFARALLAWFDTHGRRDLPWQHPRTPYRVWVSEIMLQQTQVSTVIPYFERFIARFPDVQTLAAAGRDDVLEHWAGLGYYARGRNLHKAAGIICQAHDGRLPENLDALQALPGIGRSTAAAILALAHGQRHAILDGNVKRVLARWHAVDGWPGHGSVAATLWQHAETHTPSTRLADYTQAIMDLGATLCTRSRPACPACPVAAGCQARRHGTPQAWPARKPRRESPLRHTVFVIARDAEGRVLLERRPDSGVWGGLWCFPEALPADRDSAIAPEAATDLARHWGAQRLGTPADDARALPGLRHVFTHFRLEITPVMLRLEAGPGPSAGIAEASAEQAWHSPEAALRLGIPAPVSRLLTQLEHR